VSAACGLAPAALVLSRKRLQIAHTPTNPFPHRSQAIFLTQTPWNLRRRLSQSLLTVRSHPPRSVVSTF